MQNFIAAKWDYIIVFKKKRDYITDSYEHDSTMNMTLGYKKSEIYVYHFREILCQSR